MNNKLYKKHKPNPKPKSKSTNNKTKSQSKNKSGGAFPSFPSLSGLFSKSNPENETELKPLLQQNSSNPKNIESNTSTNTQPNAKPHGFNTIKAQSRCSIL